MLVYAQMRKVLTRVALGTVAIAGIAAFSVPDAKAASATANANADIVAAIAITKTVDLDFGAVVPNAGLADTLVISAAGAKTCGSNLTCTDTVAAASFDVTGGANLLYTVTLPSSSTVTSGGNNMTVNTFADSISSAGTLSAGGAQTFTVGATLNVGIGQVAGTYTGTFDVTVVYN